MSRSMKPLSAAKLENGHDDVISFFNQGGSFAALWEGCVDFAIKRESSIADCQLPIAAARPPIGV